MSSCSKTLSSKISLVFFLLFDEHVVVEELLEPLVGVVDEQLLQDVELEDLETGDVEDADEILPRVGGVEGVVDESDDPIEHPGKERLASGGDGEVDLVHVLSLLDEILADLQLGLHESVAKVVDFDSELDGGLGDKLHAVGLGLLLATLLLPLLVAHVGDGDGTLVQTILLILEKSEGVQSRVGGAHLFGVVHTGDGQHALSDVKVIAGEGLIAQSAELPVFSVSVGHELIEDVVIPLDLQLEGDASLFQKVGLDIGGGDLGGGAEVDTDELAESRRVV